MRLKITKTKSTTNYYIIKDIKKTVNVLQLYMNALELKKRF